jgi:hypothetical protein
MDFERWGMRDAIPSFQVYEKYSGPVTERGSKGMVKADSLAKSYPGQEHHRGFDDYINHPDAEFITHARTDVPALLDEVDTLTKALELISRNFGDYMGNNSTEYYIQKAKEELQG